MGARPAYKRKMTEIDLKKFGGGFIDVFTQCCSDCGFEVFMTVWDYDEPRFATAIMQPQFARKLANMLLQAADECDEENGLAIKTIPFQWYRLDVQNPILPTKKDTDRFSRLLVSYKSGEVGIVDMTACFEPDSKPVFSDDPDLVAWAHFPEPCSTKDSNDSLDNEK